MFKHQRCKRCGKRQRFEFSIRKGLWDRIPSPYNKKTLCIECFFSLLDEAVEARKENFLAIEAEDFRFLRVVGDRIGGILFGGRRT